MTNHRIVVVLALFSAYAWAADEGPPWVRQAAAVQLPKFEAKVPAVVVLNEQLVTIDDSGRRLITTHKAIRILSRDGHREARGVELYHSGSSKVKELRAWLVSPAGQVRQLGKDSIVDIAAAPNDIYSDVRERVAVAEGQATNGALFAYEAVSEDKSIFTQFEWEFQDQLPAMASRFVLAMPSGWRAESVVFNAGKIEPVISGSTYTWEMHDLPPIDSEPLGPGAYALAPRVGVTFFPPGAAKNAGPSFATWKDVSVFQSSLADDRQTTSAEMTAKVRELIGGAGTEFQKIAALGKYVQGVNYIAVSTNLGRGGGYRPHAAADVFAKSYGDCKDKANLLRTMLRLAGVDSYLVAIHSGDRTFARAEWPSPYHFNHMIIAIKVTRAVVEPAVLDHPELGRLLFFDPTDDEIQPGYLPGHEQGSYALVAAGDKGALIKMPVTAAAENRIEREAEFSVAPDGLVSVKLRERTFGETAAAMRYQQTRQAPDDYKRQVERWLARSGATQSVGNIHGAAVEPAGAFERTIEYTTSNLAQTMQARLLMVKPVPAPFYSALFAEPHRKYPVLLEARRQSEQVRVVVPEGFQVDEVPEPVKLETAYGNYTATYVVQAGVVTVKREMEIRASTVPVEQYPELRAFFGRVLGSVQSPIVFVKK